MSRIFFDLDRTLYDADGAIAPVLRDMQTLGPDSETITAARRKLDDIGYSFEHHLERLGIPNELVHKKADVYRAMTKMGDRFLYPGVIEGLGRLATTYECLILTFGYPPFQEYKIQCIDALKSYIKKVHYVDMKPPTKGDVIQSYGEFPTWFIDDSPTHLLDTQAKAPWTRCVRMLWEGSGAVLQHPEDGRSWPVVKNMEELLHLIEVDL